MIHLHSLGQCMISLGATRIVPTAKLMFASALYVAVEGVRPIARESMASLFWPDLDEERATHSLRQALYRLRAAGVPISGDSERIQVPDGVVTTDYSALLASDASVPVNEMLERIPGGFLPGYIPSISGPFAEWVEGQRERVNAVLRRQLVSGITTLRAAGDWPATQALAQRCLELDPLNEEATLALAEAMAMDGSKARAIMLIERYMNEVGPRSKELYLPATTLKKRISELYPLPPVIEREPPHTGREEQMEMLDAALKDARQGRGSAFLISGPPGMGKTRLVTEFTRAAQLQGIATVRSQMGRHDDHRPLGAWSDVVPALQRMAGALGCDPESLPFLRRLTTYDATQTTPTPETQDAEYLFARMRMSIIDLVCAVASESCVILLVEDVHWMDEWSWDVMTALTKKLEKTGVVILMTRRDGEEPSTPVPDNAVLQEVVLEPLDDPKCRKLFGLLGPAFRASEAEFADWCIKTSHGNPYFLIELGRRGSRADGRFVAPQSLTRLIAQRFAEVAPLSRRILQVAALLGRHATLARVERVLGESRVAILDGFEELERHCLVLLHGVRISCTHDLLGISALDQSSPTAVRALEVHVATAMSLDADEEMDASFLWDCAEHLVRVGQVERAAAIYEKCAFQACATGAIVEGARALDRAVALLPAGRRRDELHAERIQALYAASEFESLLVASKAYRGHTQSAAMRVHTPEEICEIEAEYCCRFEAAGELIDRLAACVESQSATKDHRVRAAALALRIAEVAGYQDRVTALFKQLSPDLTDSTNLEECQTRMIFETSFGSVEAGAGEARRILDLLGAQQVNPAVRSRLLLHCATALLLNGEDNTGTALIEEAIALSEALQLPRIGWWARKKKAEWAIHVGRYDEAALLLGDDRMIGTSRDYRSRAALRNRARVALHQGDAARAVEILQSIGIPADRLGSAERFHLIQIATLVRLRGEGWVPTDNEMRELLRVYRSEPRTFGKDQFLVALLEALAARGEHEAMPALVTEHVVERRQERCSLAFELQACLDRFGLVAPGYGSESRSHPAPLGAETS